MAGGVIHQGHKDLICCEHGVRVGGCRCMTSGKYKEQVACPGLDCPGRRLASDTSLSSGWHHPAQSVHTCQLPHPRDIPPEAVVARSIWTCDGCYTVFTYQGIYSPASQPPDHVTDQTVWTKPRITPIESIRIPPWAVVR